jgi:RNA polymerase sigma-54 factor
MRDASAQLDHTMQARGILELSTVDLQALVHSELEQNPLLEEVEHPSDEPTATLTANIAGKLVLPDLILQQVGAEYVVTINHKPIPQIRISEIYADLLAEAGMSAEVRDYARAKTDAAKRLIESLERRHRVLLIIGRVIVEFQKDFLENPSRDSVTPMPLSRFAVLVGLDETSVCHSLSNKYIETPFGLFELAYFFAS